MTFWRVMSVALLIGVGCSCTHESSRAFQIRSLVPDEQPAFEAAVYQTTGTRLTNGHSIEVINDGRVFDVIAQEIRAAQQSVNVVVFIWRPGAASEPIVQALTERARAGVKCRVLVDPVGSIDFEEKVKPVLDEAGCHTHFFRPLPADENLARNHRKIVITDGRSGVTGGFGIHDSWIGDGDSPKEWRDVNARVRGPVVSQMQQAFAENWQEQTGELLPVEDFPYLQEAPIQPAGGELSGARAAFISSTANPEVTTAERITQLMVQRARKRLWIAQSYFTPNDPLRELLIERARAGVEVRVLAPGNKNDHPEITALQRATYDELLPAGIRIWEYQPSMMHAKTMLVDDDLALIGSINYDFLSFSFLEEGSLLIQDAATAEELARIFEDDLTRSKEIVPNAEE